ncbi:MAG: response regulator, partial [Lachnospiraceae bacterium]|nr:response regulator [Lachnospiraceae bacterium]
ILLINNRDVLWKKDDYLYAPAYRAYRYLLYGITAYYITDMLWGILESHHLVTAVYIDTVIHFIAMATAVMLWTRYVIVYLGNKQGFGRFLYYAGSLFLCFEIVIVTVNFFVPVLFSFDTDGEYHAGIARYITLAIQIILFILTSLYTLINTSKTRGTDRRRHLTIGLFGIAITIFISVQLFYPLLPFYAMGYLLGTCLLHSFVVEDEKDEYREALKSALRTAEEASKAKSAFLSNMSHEIRTPMNAIIGINNIALNDPSTGDKTKEYLRKIGASARHLLEIINDILDMSRIESGKLTLKNEPFKLSDEIDQVNTIIIGQCNEKNLKYDFEVKGSIDGYYIGDAMKLKQVLINILGNSVKFTPDGGSIDFRIEEVSDDDSSKTLRYIISDTGIGISSEYLPHIYDAFSQEDNAATGKYGSTGLGMPITKSIVEMMDGQIEVKSEKGKGTTFTLTLTFDKSEIEGSSDASSDHTIPDAGATDKSLDGKRVLLAEDMPVNAEIMVAVLGTKGVQTDVAENGRIAVDLFTSHEAGYYMAVFMDMRMPEVDGLEATKIIRSSGHPDAASIPIIALTANAFDEDVQKTRNAGMNDHLSKPVEPELIFKILRKYSLTA